jgi:hypothetical protein
LSGFSVYTWIRLLHLLGLLALGLVALLWVRTLRLALAGTIAVAAVILFHPALPQAWGSIDGMDSLYSTALLWLGAWCAYRFRDCLDRQLPLVLMLFVLAVGFKEYAFAMAPLCAWVAICFSPRRRFLRAAIVGGAVCLAIVAILIIRQYVVPLSDVGTHRGFEYILLTPRQILLNFAILATGALFFGNSIFVYVHQSPAIFAMVALAVLLAGAVIAIGLLRYARQDRLDVPREREPARWIIFLLGSLLAGTFPIWIMFHVSEMYLPPIILPLALLCGLSADGYRQATTKARAVVALLAIVALISSLLTIRVKIDGLHDVGDRAAEQIRQILSYLPPDASDKKIAILFDTASLPARRTYAVYRMGDEVLLVHAGVLEWPRPEKNLRLTSLTNEPLPNPEQYDLILHWNNQARRFEKR